VPVVVKKGDRYSLDYDRPRSIGRVRDFMGTIQVVVRSYAWAIAMGAARANIPWGRQWTSVEVGELVLFLASDGSHYITGTSMVIDGGNTLQEEFLSPYYPK
jgi:NAD(P)-dependent dehydrogenase (short-subunit alcohol dehydrogenase family)